MGTEGIITLGLGIANTGSKYIGIRDVFKARVDQEDSGGCHLQVDCKVLHGGMDAVFKVHPH